MRLTLTPTDDHDLSVEYEQTEQWYDNSKGQLGTLGANGGYDEAKEFNRDKVILAHTWRNKVGTLESSISNTQTETIGRLIPSRAQGGSMVVSPRLCWKVKILFLILNLQLSILINIILLWVVNGGMPVSKMDYV